jgi:hypothetical protein
MDHIFRRKIIAQGHLRFSGPASVQAAAFLKQARTGRPMDRAIDTATTEKRRIRRIHDRIYLKFRDIT